MAIDVTTISALIGRYGNKVVHEQANLIAPLINILDKFESGSTGMINYKAGGIDSTSMIADGGALPVGASRDVAQLSYGPETVVSVLSIPRVAAKTAVGQADGVNLVMEELETVGMDLGRQLGRAFFASRLTPDTNFTTTPGEDGTSMSVANPGAFRVGMVVHRVDDQGVVQEAIRITNVAYDDDGFGGTLTLVRGVDDDLTDATPGDDESLWLRGGKTNTAVALNDISAAASLYGKAETADDWSGNLIDAGGALAMADLRQMSTLIQSRSGITPDCIICAPNVARVIQDLQLGSSSLRRFGPGEKLDQYGKANSQGANIVAEFEGIPVYADPNCDADTLFFLNKRFCKLHEFVKLGLDSDGAEHNSNLSGRSGLLVSTTNLTYDAQFWGSYNLRVPRRNCHGQVSGITG